MLHAAALSCQYLVRLDDNRCLLDHARLRRIYRQDLRAVLGALLAFCQLPAPAFAAGHAVERDRIDGGGAGFQLDPDEVLVVLDAKCMPVPLVQADVAACAAWNRRYGVI